MNLLRLDGEYQNCKVSEITDTFINPAINETITECKLVDTLADGSQIKYWRFNLPMMTDRDNVMQVVFEEREEGTFMSLKSVEHPSCPPVKGVIRMFFY